MQRVWQFKPEVGASLPPRNSLTNELRYKFPKPGRYQVKLTVIKSGQPVIYTRDLTINQPNALFYLEQYMDSFIKVSQAHQHSP
jgi:hypothetical protein